MITKVVLLLGAMSRFLLRAMYPRGLAPRKQTHVSERVFFREKGGFGTDFLGVSWPRRHGRYYRRRRRRGLARARS